MRLAPWLAGLALLAAWAVVGFAQEAEPAAEPPPAEAPAADVPAEASVEAEAPPAEEAPAEAPEAETPPAEAATPPPPMPEGTSPALALVPQESVAFIHLPRLERLEADLVRFTERTGWSLGQGEHPLLDGLGRRTGLRAGLDDKAPAAVAFLDPKKYPGRYTIYILPVADWKAFLEAGGGEEMESNLYVLTGAVGPRVVIRRGNYALIASSIRTMDAVSKDRSIVPNLAPETLARASGGPMLYLNVHRLKAAHEDEIASWFRAASGQAYYRPEALPYADVMVTYLLALADFIDQMETFEAAVRFGEEGLSVDLAVKFLDGASIAELLAAQTSAPAAMPSWGNVPVTSAATLRLSPQTRNDLVLRATKFFLDKAPRPEPLAQPTKDEVYHAMQVMMESLGERMTFLSAPPAPGMGMVSETSIYDLVDPEQFREGLGLLSAAWERLANQLNFYLKIQVIEDAGEFEGVPIQMYVPKMRYGIPARHADFKAWLKTLYGPEGLVYRVAVVGDKAVVATGADLTLFREAILRLKQGEAAETNPALARLEPHLPPAQNLSIALSLPAYLGLSLLRGGTDPNEVGTVDRGSELVGLSFAAQGSTVSAASYWPHEQLRLARELLVRVAPGLAEVPESLFEPSTEGPPEGEGLLAPEPLEEESAPAPEGEAAPAPEGEAAPVPEGEEGAAPVP
ncbi:MAG: hypothetical protein WBD63_10115 [Phycisphaerae bacterium]|nr:hypothetical protein [Phycisphaerae bacterium]